MTRIVRWNPMREMMNLRRDFDRLFENALDMPLFSGETQGEWGLALDVAENDDAFVVEASVPGINPDDIDVTVADNTLTIKGEYKQEREDEGKRYHLRERRFGSFTRSVTLPTTVDQDQIEASYESGVLKLTLPKAEEVKPRRISITAGGNGNVIEGETS